MRMDVLAGKDCPEYSKLPAGFDWKLHIDAVDSKNVFYMSGHSISFYLHEDLFPSKLTPCRSSETGRDHTTIYNMAMTGGDKKAKKVFDSIESSFPDLLRAPEMGRHFFSFTYRQDNVFNIKLVAKHIFKQKTIYHFVPENKPDVEMGVYVNNSKRHCLLREIIRVKASSLGNQISNDELREVLTLVGESKLEEARAKLGKLGQPPSLTGRDIDEVILAVVVVFLLVIVLASALGFRRSSHTYSMDGSAEDWFPGLGRNGYPPNFMSR
jgi:hypothetical protein